MDIKSNEIASAIGGGFAAEEYWQQAKDWIGSAMLPVVNAFQGAHNWAKKNVPGYAWWLDWWANDKVGATAGALLGVVVIVVAGYSVGGLSGGIASLIKAIPNGPIARYFGGLALSQLIYWGIKGAVRGSTFLWNVNWLESDASIAQQQDAILNSLAGQLGEVAGVLVGTSLCGIIPIAAGKRLKFIKTDPTILARIKELSEVDGDGNPIHWVNGDRPELYDELFEAVSALLQNFKNQGMRYVFLESYKNVRKMVRGAYQGWFKGAFPETAEKINKWIANQNGHWSFASAVEDAIDNIGSDKLRNFTEEFYDAALDSCSESAMIIADSFRA